MKPICIIPARSGSKGLQDKNMLFLDGKPLIFHTIQAAIDSQLFDLKDIIVSTDSKDYALICQSLGVTTVIRSEELASDTATTFELLADFLISYPDNQEFILLQATSPLRTGQQIREAYTLFKESHCEHVVSVCQADKSPMMFSQLSDEGMLEGIIGIDKGYRRQNSDAYYYPNGAIYMSTKRNYLAEGSFFTPYTKAYVMTKATSLDIDDRYDFVYSIGSLYFDYERREQKNKAMYQRLYLENRNESATKIMLGDSRLVGLTIDDFINYSIGGVTLATVLENIDDLVTEKVQCVFVSLGINDFITKYPVQTIKQHFLKLLDFLQGRNIWLTTIPYALFRSEVNNQEVSEVNRFLMDICNTRHIPLLDINLFLSENTQLKYEHTYDGLHFQPNTQKILEKQYRQFIGV